MTDSRLQQLRDEVVAFTARIEAENRREHRLALLVKLTAGLFAEAVILVVLFWCCGA